MSVVGALLRVKRHINYNFMVNGFHQSCVLKQKWRKRHGLTSNPNTFGPLTNLPDYSFKDGRPTPFGVRQKGRMEVQRGYAEKIIELVKQVDYAIERHAERQEEEKQKKQEILDNKLKPKGNLVLQTGKNNNN